MIKPQSFQHHNTQPTTFVTLGIMEASENTLKPKLYLCPSKKNKTKKGRERKKR